MANQSNEFNAWIRGQVAALLKGSGFGRTGHLFKRQCGHNWLLIEFQKSLKSRADATIFTVNLAVWNEVIGQFMHTERPSAVEAHWSLRLGDLLPTPSDHWWKCEANDCAEALALLTTRGMPTLAAMCDDEALVRSWLGGHCPGATRIQCLMYLSILLTHASDNERRNLVIEEMRSLSRGRPVSNAVEVHIAQLLRWEQRND